MRYLTSLIGCRVLEKERNGAEVVFKGIMAENFPELTQDTNPQFQKAL